MASRVTFRKRPSATDHGGSQTTAAMRTSLSPKGGTRRPALRFTTTDRFSLSSDPGSSPAVRVAAFWCRGVTLVELLAVVAVLALLAALALPALAAARHAAMETKGAAQTREIGTATLLHMDDHQNRLPQLRLTPAGRTTEDPGGFHLPWLFGGARSVVDVFGAAGVGAEARPLNPYLGDFGPSDRPDVFRDPLDDGTHDDQLTGYAPHRSDATLFDLVGTSYVLNDHALDEIPCPFVEIFNTLIPQGGGPAPVVATPARTWLAGQSPIYNYDDGGDKREVWGRDRVRASLAFLDGHVKVAVPVPPGPVNTTEHYTFFPHPGWGDRFTPQAGGR